MNGMPPNSTQMKEATPLIAPIDQSTVKRIVAGQAISDLASCVKELVDNALDAGATSIQVHLTGQGYEVVQVSDNGTGVPTASRALLATKHATSKLSQFSDLYQTSCNRSSSLGFRGEALFCLASISESLCVTTRCTDEVVGQQLWYDREGKLEDSRTTSVSRQVGCTVSLSKLFHMLPVRRADLKKRLKAQRAKLFRLLQGYAILSVGTRFNITEAARTRGKSQNVKSDVKLATSASKSLEQTVSSVLGAKFLSGLCKFNLDLLDLVAGVMVNLDGTGNEDSGLNEKCNRWGIEGLVSKAPSERHANARDLHFFSVNGRPVELPKVSRAVSDAWRSFDSSGKRPACMLRFQLPNEMYDVNVSPDKREVLMSEEEAICSKLRDSLIELWSQSNGVFVENEVEIMSKKAASQNNVTLGSLSTQNVSSLSSKSSRKTSGTHDSSISSTCRKGESQPRKMNELRTSMLSHSTTDFRSIVTPNDDGTNDSGDKEEGGRILNSSSVKTGFNSLPALQGFALNAPTLAREEKNDQSPKKKRKTVSQCSSPDSPSRLEKQQWEKVQGTFNRPVTSDISFEQPNIGIALACSSSRKKRLKKSLSNSGIGGNGSFEETTEVNDSIDTTSKSEQSVEESTAMLMRKQRHSRRNAGTRGHEPRDTKNNEAVAVWSNFGTDEVIREFRSAHKRTRRTRKILRDCATNKVNGSVKESIEACNEVDEGKEEGESNDDRVSLFKEEFLHLEIIGQFNLGFILARCRNQNLWILDQHACDERYNFEKLCEKTVIHEQQLIAPLPLELSPSEENCIQENMSVFKMNGFRFKFDADKPPRQRFALTGIPHSGSGSEGRRATEFGKDDVGALLYMLGANGSSSSSGYEAGSGTGADGSGSMGNNAVRRYAGLSIDDATGDNWNDKKLKGGVLGKALVRLPKAVAMFASRACRSSVMIGTALSHRDMEALVRKMNDVEQPWNCAHGRPTMRHVKNLRNILIEDETNVAKHIAESSLVVLTQDDETFVDNDDI